MKKTIALAVASAFVAPVAIAADITVSGQMAHYVIAEEIDQGGQVDRSAQETTIAIGATSETDSGVVISAYYGLNGDGGDDGGDSIKVSTPTFGTFQIGDVASATDAVDDKTEVLRSIDPLTGTSDSQILYTLPTFAEGLTLLVSFSPDDGNGSPAERDFDTYTASGSIVGLRNDEANEDGPITDDGAADGNALTADENSYTLSQRSASYSAIGNEGNGGEAKDEMGFGGVYQFGPVRLAAAQSEYDFETAARFNEDGTVDRLANSGTRENRFYGVQFSLSGVTVAYEDLSSDFTSLGDGFEDFKQDASAFSLTYSFNDITLAGLHSDRKQTVNGHDDEIENEITAYGVHYDVGAGLTLIAETGEQEDKDRNRSYDFTTLGLSYAF